MPPRFIHDYFDSEYLQNQELLEDLSDDLISINFKAIKNEEDLIRTLIKQNRGYQRKALSLYEELSKGVTQDPPLSVRNKIDQQSKIGHWEASSIKKSEAGDSAQKDKMPALDDEAKMRHLENKVEYLNNLIVETKKQLETKTNELKGVQGIDQDKFQFLNETISHLKEQNGELTTEKSKLEGDIQELLSEFSIMKKKYEAELGAALESKTLGNGVSANKRLIDAAYLENLEGENKRLTEQQEFSERLEDLDKFKETLAEREKKISYLQSQLELYQRGGNSNNELANYQVIEMKSTIKNLQKEVHDLHVKNKIEGHPTDMTRDDRSTDADLTSHLQRCNSKLVNLVEALRLLNERPSARQSVASHSTSTPDHLKLLSVILDSTQALKGQLEENKHIENEVLLKHVRDILSNELKLFHDIRLAPKEPVSDPFSTPSTARSPARGHHTVKETILKAQEEIAGTLRHSVNNLQQTNYNELTHQLQIQMERNSELTDKIDYLTKCLHSLSLVVNEELMRCLFSIDSVLRLDSLHDALLATVKDNLNSLKSRFQGTFTKQVLATPQYLEAGDLRGEYEKQRGIWEEHIKMQQASFEKEILQLTNLLKAEQDQHDQIKRRHEDKLADLKDELELQKAQHKHEIARQQDKIEALEANLRESHQSIDLLQKSLRDLECSLEDRQRTLANYSTQISDLQGRGSSQETEIYRLESEISQSRRENDNLIQKLDDANHSIKELQKRLELLEERAGRLDMEKQSLSDDLTERRKDFEQDRNRYERELDELRDEQKKYAVRTELSAKEMKESYERLIEDYTRQLEQIRNTYEEYRADKEGEMRSRRDEIRQLNLRVQTAEEVGKTQEAALKRRDEKINSLMEERSQTQAQITELERQLPELISLRDKNKKNIEAISESRAELSAAKLENQSLSHEKERLEGRLGKLERENEERRAEVEKLKQTLRTTEGKLTDLQNETFALKTQLEAEKQSGMRKDNEIKTIHENNQVQSRAATTFKDELIQRLKEDVRSISSEYEGLRTQYNRLQERNEELSRESHRNKDLGMGVDKSSTFREMEQISDHNDNLLEEIQQMKRDLKKKDDEISLAKRAYKQEVVMSQKKLRDVSSRLGADDYDRYEHRGIGPGSTIPTIRSAHKSKDHL